MDSPWIVALLVFLGIFLMFVLISLLADLLIIGTAISCAAAAYFMPNWYPLFFDFVKDTQLPVYLGLADPSGGALEQVTLYSMSALLVFGGTLICIPALPFSATYRQILGANKIGKSDETFVRALVRSELDDLDKPRKKPQATTKPQPQPQPQPHQAVSKSRRPPLPELPREREIEFEPQIEPIPAPAAPQPLSPKES